MDAVRLADVLRTWGSSRRPVLGAGFGALLGLAGITTSETRKKKKGKKKKKKGKPQTPSCVAKPVSQTCAGKCGSATDNCGAAVSCACPAGQCCNGKGACGACLAFVSSSGHLGKLGGLTGADAICQNLAAAAHLPGSYMAWLSDSTGSPSTRFTKASAPYTLVDGTVVASSWVDLTDGAIAHGITLTEQGVIRNIQTWSNTKADGTPGSTRAGTPAGGQHCQNWTSNFAVDTGYLGFNLAGLDKAWTDFERGPAIPISARCTVSCASSSARRTPGPHPQPLARASGEGRRPATRSPQSAVTTPMLPRAPGPESPSPAHRERGWGEGSFRRRARQAPIPPPAS